MQHDDHVRARRQSLAVASLLIASVPIVAVMPEDIESQPPSQFDGLIAAVIVHKNADVDQRWKFRHRGFERLLRVICGHDDRYSFAVEHGRPRVGTLTSVAELSA